MNMEKLAKDLYTGVEGLQIFMDNFAGVDIFEEDQLAMLDIILAKADGFAAGVATIDELSKAAVVTSQPAPRGRSRAGGACFARRGSPVVCSRTRIREKSVPVQKLPHTASVPLQKLWERPLAPD